MVKCNILLFREQSSRKNCFLFFDGLYRYVKPLVDDDCKLTYEVGIGYPDQYLSGQPHNVRCVKSNILVSLATVMAKAKENSLNGTKLDKVDANGQLWLTEFATFLGLRFNKYAFLDTDELSFFSRIVKFLFYDNGTGSGLLTNASWEI